MKTIKKKNILTKILHLVLLSTTVFVSCCLTAKNNKKNKDTEKTNQIQTNKTTSDINDTNINIISPDGYPEHSFIRKGNKTDDNKIDDKKQNDNEIKEIDEWTFFDNDFDKEELNDDINLKQTEINDNYFIHMIKQLNRQVSATNNALDQLRTMMIFFVFGMFLIVVVVLVKVFFYDSFIKEKN